MRSIAQYNLYKLELYTNKAIIHVLQEYIQIKGYTSKHIKIFTYGKQE